MFILGYITVDTVFSIGAKVPAKVVTMAFVLDVVLLLVICGSL